MTSEFHLAMTAACELCKAASIPEVEAVKRLLTPILRLRLERIGDRLAKDLLRRMNSTPASSLKFRKEVFEAVLASMMTDADRVYSLPFNREVRDQVRDSVDALLAAGSTITGAGSQGPLLPIQAQVAEQELVLLLQEALSRQGGEMKKLLSTFLGSEAVREAQGLLGTASNWDQELGRLLGLGDSLEPTVDSWAYRTFNAAAVAASFSGSGVIGYQIVANLDGRETAFCHWVHGRIVPVSRVRRQQEAHSLAVLRGDRAGMIRATPFLDSAVAKRGSEVAFERFFRRAGLPPYHFGCRSGSRVIRA